MIRMIAYGAGKSEKAKTLIVIGFPSPPAAASPSMSSSLAGGGVVVHWV
jgi:hypothetical protein